MTQQHDHDDATASPLATTAVPSSLGIWTSTAICRNCGKTIAYEPAPSIGTVRPYWYHLLTGARVCLARRTHQVVRTYGGDEEDDT